MKIADASVLSVARSPERGEAEVVGALPRLHQPLLERGRLFDALDAGVSETALTLVSAPPGSGKTVLLTTWLRTRPPHGTVLWLPIGAGERPPLWSRVLHALGSPAQVVVDDDAPGDFVDRLALAVARRQERLVLVVDDLHNASAPALAVLQRLLQAPPPTLRVVVASRIDPPLGLHVLRVAGDLAELRASDLAFREEEAGALLAASGCDVSAAELAAVLGRTEGWAAGLRLLALALARRSDRGAALERLALDERPIAEYLAAEALDTQPPDVRDFLLRTSIVEVLDARLADALTGRSDAERLLERLCRENLFLTRLEGDRRFYRFHQLFRALLLAEARCELGEELTELHERAAVLLAERGRPVEALDHAARAERWELVASLLAEHWAAAVTDRGTGVRALVAAPSGGYAAASPVLGAFAALVRLVDGDHRGASALLTDASRRRQRVPAAVRPHFDGLTRYAEVLAARGRGRLGRAALLAAEEVEQAAVESSSAAGEDCQRALGLAAFGAAQLWRGAEDEARAALEEAVALARATESTVAEADALSHLALLELEQGRPRRAARLARGALDLDATGGAPGRPPALVANAVLASAQHGWGDEDAARASLAAADGIARRTADAPGRVLLARTAGELAASAGGEEAEAALLHLRAVRTRNPAAAAPLAASTLTFVEVRLLAASGRTQESPDTLVAANGDARAAAAAARLHLVDGRPADALAALRRRRAATPTQETEALVLEALAQRALGADDEAQRSLAAALALAEPEGLRRPFLDGGAQARELLARHLRTANGQRWLAGELVAALDGRSGRDATPADLLEPLSARELEVLRYLPTAMSNADIAVELFVSVNTVKTHVKSIYRKLGAARRQDAVRRARQLRLLA